VKVSESQLESFKKNWTISRRQKQQEEIRTLMNNHVKLLEEEKIKMVTVTTDLRRQNAFTLDIYNFHQCQHTALINLLIEANHARLVAKATADHWRQRFEDEHRKLDLNPAGKRSEKVSISIT